MLTIYGAISNNAIYARSLGINVNSVWGVALLVFAIAMLALGSRKKRTRSQPVTMEQKMHTTEATKRTTQAESTAADTVRQEFTRLHGMPAQFSVPPAA